MAKKSMAFIILLLIISIIVTSSPTLGKQEKHISTVNVSWNLKFPATATEDSKTDSGVIAVPLNSDHECSALFKVEKILFTGDFTNKEKVETFIKGLGNLSTLEVLISKLFQGRGEVPIIRIHQKNKEIITLRFDDIIDFNAWPKKNYRIHANFNADNFVDPKFWTQVDFWCTQTDRSQLSLTPTKPLSTPELEEGRKLHLLILKKYPKLDRIYQKPMLYGAMTSNPKAIICLPLKKWDSLQKKNRNLLCKYISSLIKEMRANPFEYLNIPPDAPIASTIRNNATKMKEDSWAIAIGHISEDGRDIISDKFVQCDK